MDAREAMFQVDEVMGELSGEIQKVTFCRDMIQGVIENGGGFDVMGDDGRITAKGFWGLIHIIDDLEKSFRETREQIQGLFNQSKTETVEG